MQRKPFLSIDDILNGNLKSVRNCQSNSCENREMINKRASTRETQIQQINRKPRAYLYPYRCFQSSASCKVNPWWYRNHIATVYHYYLREHLLRQPRRRFRASFSHEQVLALQKVFKSNKYLCGEDRRELARKLHMTEQQIKIWFQNRRYKEKRKGRQQFEDEVAKREIFSNEPDFISLSKSKEDKFEIEEDSENEFLCSLT